MLERGFDDGGSAVEVNQQIVRLGYGAAAGSERHDAAPRSDGALRRVERGVERCFGLGERQAQCAIQIATGCGGEASLQRFRFRGVGPELRADSADDEEITEDERC